MMMCPNYFGGFGGAKIKTTASICTKILQVCEKVNELYLWEVNRYLYESCNVTIENGICDTEENGPFGKRWS